MVSDPGPVLGRRAGRMGALRARYEKPKVGNFRLARQSGSTERPFSGCLVAI